MKVRRDVVVHNFKMVAQTLLKANFDLALLAFIRKMLQCPIPTRSVLTHHRGAQEDELEF